jgi:hypothetical protein
MPIQHSFTSRTAHPQLGTNWWELQPKRTVVRGGKDTKYSSTPTSITGKAKAMEMTSPWERRDGTITGMAVANTAEAQRHYNTATSWHTQLGAVRKVYLTVLGCSKDGLCLCLKVKRETRETLGQIQKMRMSSMQMVSKLDMPCHSIYA